MSSDTPLNLTVTHKGVAHRLSFSPDSAFADFQARLEELTSVPPSHQKFLYKGKKPSLKDEDTLLEAGLKPGMKVQMLGSTPDEIGGLRAAEDEHNRKERILKERAAKPQAKLRSTSSPSTGADLKYRFHRIEPLQHLPDPAAARSRLDRLANDPAIRHVMQKHQFAVGVLTELAPHEQPHLLGLNVNSGEAIKLRLRTDAYDGFRPYKDVRRVLCHELTHNVWGDHDNNFKELNSKLNREVAEFERAEAEGTHYLTRNAGDFYEPTSELEAEAQARTLGGRVLGGANGGIAVDESREERRRKMLEATMNRLRKEEEELEQSCGTAGPSASR